MAARWADNLADKDRILAAGRQSGGDRASRIGKVLIIAVPMRNEVLELIQSDPAAGKKSARSGTSASGAELARY